MTRNLSRGTLSAPAAYSRPFPTEVQSERRKARQKRSPAHVDVLGIAVDPALAVYLSGLFQRFGWAVRCPASLDEAREFLEDATASVAICEEVLPDAVWQDAVRTLRAMPDAPNCVVIGGGTALLDEVSALGGFDVLTRPLRKSEVIWTVASAWHQWMNRFENRDEGGALCSDA